MSIKQLSKLNRALYCRASKSAQNQLSKCMAIEFARRKQNIAVVMLHPGTVDTDLSQPFQKVQTALFFQLLCTVPLLICNPGEDLALELCLLNGRGVFTPTASLQGPCPCSKDGCTGSD